MMSFPDLGLLSLRIHRPLHIPLECSIRDPIWTHVVFPEMSHCGARRLAGKLVGSADCVAEFNAGRGYDEVHRPTPIALHAHVNRHGRIMAPFSPERAYAPCRER